MKVRAICEMLSLSLCLPPSSSLTTPRGWRKNEKSETQKVFFRFDIVVVVKSEKYLCVKKKVHSRTLSLASSAANAPQLSNMRSPILKKVSCDSDAARSTSAEAAASS